MIDSQMQKRSNEVALKYGAQHDGLVVFSKPECHTCMVLKGYLQQQNVPYTTIDVTQYPGAEGEEMRSTIITPTMAYKNETLSGFYENKVNDFIERHQLTA